MKKWLHSLPLLALAACGGQSMSDRVIVQNDEFCVSGDSVVSATVSVWAVDATHIVGDMNLNSAEQMLQHLSASDTLPYCLTTAAMPRSAPTDDYPRYQSHQMLIDALYNLSVSDITANYSQSNGFNAHGDCASLNTAIYLALAALNPGRAMATLRNQVSDSYVVQQQGTWPVCDDRLTWPVAAWEVYCLTGDADWLAEAYEVSLNTIDEELEVLLNRHSGLLNGSQPARNAWHGFFPQWAGAPDQVAGSLLINNVLAVRAMEVTNLMAEELDTEQPYTAELPRLREAVNQTLWDENAGRYSAYCLGQIRPTRVPLCDNVAQAMAVIWDLADDDRSTTLIEKTPIGHRGISPYYPIERCIEPYLEYSSWSLTQACWNIASAMVGNDHALRRGMAALYRAQAFYQPQHIIIERHPVNTLTNAAGNVAMVLRVLAGMRFTADGIEFQPTVPAWLPGNKTILNLNYRAATIDITLVGTGNDIDLMTLDGQIVEGDYVPADIEGHHNLVIKLQQARGGGQHVTLAGHQSPLPAPDVRWSRDSAFVTNWQPGVAYKLAINGMRSYSVSDSAFSLPPLAAPSELTLLAVDRNDYSLPSRPLLVSGGMPITINVTDTTLVADTLALEVRLDHAAVCLLTADYRLTSGCDLISVEANGHLQGTLLLTAGNAPESRRSHPLTVKLLRGSNRLLLRRYPGGSAAVVSRLLIIR